MPKTKRSSRKTKSSIKTEDVENNPRLAAMQDLLKDFDAEVQTRVNKMRQLETSIIQELKTYVATERRKIPQHVLDMKVSDYLKSGGRLDYSVVTNVDEMLDNLIQETVGTNRPLAENKLPELADIPQTVMATAKKSRKKIAPPEIMATAARQTRRTVAQTPFIKATEAKTKTPAVWRAEAVLGEGRLETQQFVEGEKPYLMVPLTGKEKGNVMLMTDNSQLDDLPVAGLNSPVMRSMRAMKDRLSMMIKLATTHKKPETGTSGLLLNK